MLSRLRCYRHCVVRRFMLCLVVLAVFSGFGCIAYLELSNFLSLSALDVDLPRVGYLDFALDPVESFLPTNANVAIVSLHRSWKFSGYMGWWLDANKAAYASKHGYAYLNQNWFPKEEDLFPLSSWQREGKRQLIYDKQRYLLYMMARHRSLEYFLWIDGDCVVTGPHIKVEDRLRLFNGMHLNNSRARKLEEACSSRCQPRSELENACWRDCVRMKRLALEQRMYCNDADAAGDCHACLIWGVDGMGPNAGVMLLRNTALTRSLLEVGLSTFHVTQQFTDQDLLKSALRANSTYDNCVLCLNGQDMRLLQSRSPLRRVAMRYQWMPGDWLLHLPNHNRNEIVEVLETVLQRG